MSDQPPSSEQHDHEDDSSESEAFWEIIDTFIDLANEHVKDGKGESVSPAMTYAAARFSAFVVAASAEGLESLKEEKEKAVEFFTERFKSMLDDNITEYIENYSEYTGPDDNT